MHISCATETLVQGVAAVERAVSNSDTQPILAGILLEAADGTLRLTATDREIGIETVIAADVTTEGACVIDGRLLSAMVRRLSSEQTSLQLEPNSQVVIRSGSTRFSVPTRGAEEFPRIKGAEEAPSCKLLQNEMRKLIRHTIFAVSHEESRPYLTGIMMELEDTEIRAVSTDANRLALRKGTLTTPVSEPVRVIVPGKSLAELARLLQTDEEAQIEMAIADNQVIFSLPGTRFVTRLIEGQFPDYKRVFPASYHTKIVADRKLLLAAVDRAALIARKGTPTVRLHVKDGGMVLTATEAEVGDLYEEMLVTQEGGDLEMSYQSRFLSDVLRVIEESHVVIEMGDGLLPAVIYGEGDEAYRYVVMPVRVG